MDLSASAVCGNRALGRGVVFSGTPLGCIRRGTGMNGNEVEGIRVGTIRP